jgi:hypothetical protein
VGSPQLNQAHSDFLVRKDVGLGKNPAGRDALIQENTDRNTKVNDWKAAQPAVPNETPEVREARLNGTLEQMDPPLMRHGRVNDSVDVASYEQTLFAGTGADRKALISGQPGAEKLTAASAKLAGRDKALADIHTRLDGFGYTDQQKKDILGTQMPEGGPLVDKDGKLLDGVTEGQLQRYGEALGKRSQSVDKMNERVADLDKKLKGPPELTGERKEAMQKRRDDWAKRADDRKKEVKEGITQDAVRSYQSKLPRLIKGAGHSSDQVVQLMNGGGYLGEGADLEKIASATRRYEAADSPQEKAALKKEGLQDIAQGGGAFIVPTGEGDAANQAVTIKRQLDSKEAVYGQTGQGGAQGGKLSEEETMAIQQEHALEQLHEQDRMKIEGEERALSAELDKEIRQEESQIAAEERLEAKELRMKEVDFGYQKQMAGIQTALQTLSQGLMATYQAALQAMQSQVEAQNRRLEAESQRTPLMAIQQGIANSLFPSGRA